MGAIKGFQVIGRVAGICLLAVSGSSVVTIQHSPCMLSIVPSVLETGGSARPEVKAHQQDRSRWGTCDGLDRSSQVHGQSKGRIRRQCARGRGQPNRRHTGRATAIMVDRSIETMRAARLARHCCARHVCLGPLTSRFLPPSEKQERPLQKSRPPPIASFIDRTEKLASQLVAPVA